MAGNELLSEQVAAGFLLILSSLVFVVGGKLYTGRVIWKWQVGEKSAYLLWERSFVLAAVLFVTLVLVLLERLLEGAGGRILAMLGMTRILIGAGLISVAETFSMSQKEWTYAPVVVSVILAFLGQAAFGLSILHTGFLPGNAAGART